MKIQGSTWTTVWQVVRKYASATLVTLILGIGALLILLTGFASPWFGPSEEVFRTIVLISLGAILAFLVAERVVIQRVTELAERGVIRGALLQADQVNMAASRVLLEAAPRSPEDQVVCVATLPKHSGRKRRPATPPAGVELFTNRLVVQATTPGWRVRHLLNFSIAEDFDRWLLLEERMTAAAGYEARAYVTSGSLPILAPLIVANEHVLLGSEDPQEARLLSAVHLQGRAVAVWATRYFDDLWDSAPFQLRSQRGRQSEVVEALRRKLGPSVETGPAQDRDLS